MEKDSGAVGHRLPGRLAMRFVSCLVLALSLAASGQAGATPAPGMVDLGTLGGGYSYATAMNEGGQVVGSSYTLEGRRHAFSWTQPGGMVDLGGTVPGSGIWSEAVAVNDGGQVVGYSNIAGPDYHAFSWTQAGGMVDIGTLGGSYSEAVAVNDDGQVVGQSYVAAGAPYVHAFTWSQAGGMIDIGTLGGGFWSQATAVNTGGQVVGYGNVPSNAEPWAQIHAFSWTQAGGLVDIGTLGGSPSHATAVNDGGQVVGYSATAGNAETHAFSWTQADGLVDLGTLGGTNSEAVAVNDGGQVAGSSYAAGDPAWHATLWETVSSGPGPTAHVVLSPLASTSSVGTTHTVTATLTDAGGLATPGTSVVFKVSGSVTTSGSCTADTAGACSFTYTGPDLPGADAIVGWADLDGNGLRGDTEPYGEATKAWTQPATTPGQVTGGGQIPNSRGVKDIAFGFNAKSDSSGVKGNCNVVDISPATNIKINCTTLTGLVVSGAHATIFATGTINGVSTTIRIDVDDLAEPGKGHDTFKVSTSTGYSASGTLLGGNVQIHT